MVLVVRIIILTVGSVVSVFSGEASLDALVHGGTLEALLLSLALVGHVLLVSVAGVGHVAA